MAITFIDGPAKGVALNVTRAPIMLRVTFSGKWDCLNLLEDIPAPNEALYCYIMYGDAIMAHIRPGGFQAFATYKLLEPQPSDHDMRTRWPEWCEENKEWLLSFHK